MWVKNSLKLSKYKQLSIIILTGIFMNIEAADAQKLDAGFVLNEMNLEKRYTFVAGVIEGMAYSRFLRDRPNEEGMKCISSWFYGGGEKSWKKIYAIFKQYPKRQPAVLIYTLTKKKCGA